MTKRGAREPSARRVYLEHADDGVIACAVAGRANVIVSGDRDLLDLQVVGRIPILTAAQFLARLENDNRQ